MLIGIDHLARINDAFGFDVADAVISEVAKRIRSRLRGGDVLGRVSGNKFGLILKNCTVDDINVAAERFLAGIRNDVVPTKSGPVSVTASIGAVSVPRYARRTDEAINRAHETLDTAKRRRITLARIKWAFSSKGQVSTARTVKGLNGLCSKTHAIPPLASTRENSRKSATCSSCAM